VRLCIAKGPIEPSSLHQWFQTRRDLDTGDKSGGTRNRDNVFVLCCKLEDVMADVLLSFLEVSTPSDDPLHRAVCLILDELVSCNGNNPAVESGRCPLETPRACEWRSSPAFFPSSSVISLVKTTRLTSIYDVQEEESGNHAVSDNPVLHFPSPSSVRCPFMTGATGSSPHGRGLVSQTNLTHLALIIRALQCGVFLSHRS